MKVLFIILFAGFTFSSYSSEYSDYKEVVSKVNLIPKSYGNKFYITNRLSKIFGDNSLPILEENIIASHPDLAGPCDIYEQVYVEREKTETIYKECIRGKIGILAPLTGKNTVIRTSLITKACIDILNHSKVMDYLEEKTKNSSDLIQSIHDEFYPLDKKTELISKGRIIEKEYFFKKDILKRSYLLFCLSEDWQLI